MSKPQPVHTTKAHGVPNEERGGKRERERKREREEERERERGRERERVSEGKGN